MRNVIDINFMHICSSFLGLVLPLKKTPSKSVVTSEDEAVPSKPPLPLHASMGFDYVEAVHTALCPRLQSPPSQMNPLPLTVSGTL